eukprot:984037-Rhodomonas_salina.1
MSFSSSSPSPSPTPSACASLRSSSDVRRRRGDERRRKRMEGGGWERRCVKRREREGGRERGRGEREGGEHRTGAKKGGDGWVGKRRGSAREEERKRRVRVRKQRGRERLPVDAFLLVHLRATNPTSVPDTACRKRKESQRNMRQIKREKVGKRERNATLSPGSSSESPSAPRLRWGTHALGQHRQPHGRRGGAYLQSLPTRLALVLALTLAVILPQIQAQVVLPAPSALLSTRLHMARAWTARGVHLDQSVIVVVKPLLSLRDHHLLLRLRVLLLLFVIVHNPLGSIPLFPRHLIVVVVVIVVVIVIPDVTTLTVTLVCSIIDVPLPRILLLPRRLLHSRLFILVIVLDHCLFLSTFFRCWCIVVTVIIIVLPCTVGVLLVAVVLGDILLAIITVGHGFASGAKFRAGSPRLGCEAATPQCTNRSKSQIPAVKHCPSNGCWQPVGRLGEEGGVLLKR